MEWRSRCDCPPETIMQIAGRDWQFDCRGLHTESAAEPADAKPEDLPEDKHEDEEMKDDEDGSGDGESKDSETRPASGTKRKREDEPVVRTDGTEPVYLVPPQVRDIISALFAKDRELMNLMFQAQGAMDGRECAAADADMFFIHTVLVPPNKFRPVSEMDGATFEHPQNVIMSKVRPTEISIPPKQLPLDISSSSSHHMQLRSFLDHVNFPAQRGSVEGSSGLTGPDVQTMLAAVRVSGQCCRGHSHDFIRRTTVGSMKCVS